MAGKACVAEDVAGEARSREAKSKYEVQVMDWIIAGVIGLVVGFLLARPWKRKMLWGPPPVLIAHLEFDLLMRLLSRREDWEPAFHSDGTGPYYLLHKSGLKLWTENRPRRDMWFYKLGSEEECKAMFSDEERDLLRAEADKVIRDWKWAHGKPLTTSEDFLLQIRNWKTDDPELSELQQVL